VKAKLHILYFEEREFPPSRTELHSLSLPPMVGVYLHLWVAAGNGHRDYVLHTYSRAAGVSSQTQRILTPASDGEAIREAVAEFAQLVAAHPATDGAS